MLDHLARSAPCHGAASLPNNPIEHPGDLSLTLLLGVLVNHRRLLGRLAGADRLVLQGRAGSGRQGGVPGLAEIVEPEVVGEASDRPSLAPVLAEGAPAEGCAPVADEDETIRFFLGERLMRQRTSRSRNAGR